jgi:hypothetical protein
MSTQRKRSRPWWRPVVDGIDKRITPPANRLVRTTALADTVAILTRLEVRLRRQLERQSTWLMHQCNLPTAGDIRRMRGQLAAVEARLRDISERLEDQQRDAERAKAAGDGKRAATRKPRAKSSSRDA